MIEPEQEALQKRKRNFLRRNLSKYLKGKLKTKYSGQVYKVEFPVLKALKNQNYIKTTKYTLITFLPKNFAFQFRRYYNIYFLVGALSVLFGYSSISPSSQIAPLLIVLAFSAAKEAIEDFNRYRADTLANNTPVLLVKDGKRHSLPSKNLKPGDIVYIEKGAKFYVDVAILSSEYEDGTAFIETAELDGETNLKRKSALGPTCSRNTDEISSLKGVIECESPNENLVSFEGRITIDDKPTPISMLNFVPRGSVLRNTGFVYAVVIYSGLNTKIMKNLKKGKIKSSKLEKQLNNLVLAAFVFNAFLLVTSIVLDYNYYRYFYGFEELFQKDMNVNIDPYNWYLGFQTNNAGTVFFIFDLAIIHHYY